MCWVTAALAPKLRGDLRMPVSKNVKLQDLEKGKTKVREPKANAAESSGAKKEEHEGWRIG
jgi:hypothetical protein